jgi:hypothetical protein
MFFHAEIYPNCTNTICHTGNTMQICISIYLFQNIREKVKIHGQPKVLYLQFDNCYKDNKNKSVMLKIFLQFRYLFSFLSLLVKHQ